MPFSLGVVALVYVFPIVGFILSGMWISVALLIPAIIGAHVFLGPSAWLMLPRISFNVLNSFYITAMPLFIFMGAIIARSGLATSIFDAIRPVLSPIPGRLLHSNIIANSIFGAISGSSIGATATIAEIAIPQLKAEKYDMQISCGSLSAGGVMACIIPPSIAFIVFGAMCQVSIGDLFIGGIIPGILLTAAFCIYIGIASLWSRHKGKSIDGTPVTFTLKDVIVNFAKGWPVFLLIGVVLGTIYLGICTPTEAGAIGVATTVFICLGTRRITWKVVKESLELALILNGMLCFMFFCALYLAGTLINIGVTHRIGDALLASGFSANQVLILVFGIFFVLGMFFSGNLLIALTPVIWPILREFGVDGVWFGVCQAFLLEIACITPPVGLQLYILQSIAKVPLSTVMRGVIPFVIIMVVFLGLFMFFPEIILWLPSTM